MKLLREGDADVVHSLWDRLEEQGDGTFLPREGRREEAGALHPRLELAILRGFWAPPAAILYSRRIVEAIGGWRESLPVIQDARFFLDAARRGGRFVLDPEVGAIYRVHRGGSVSRSSASAFTRDVFTNASEVMDEWLAAGELDPDRRGILAGIFAGVARTSAGRDEVLFEAAIARVNATVPGYVPGAPRALSVASRILGLRSAARLAAWTEPLRRGSATRGGSSRGKAR